MRTIRLPKWSLVILAGAVYLPFVADWIVPGAGTHLAVQWLSSATCRLSTANCFPLWGWMVGLAGKDVAALGYVSAFSALLCTACVGAIFGELFASSVWVAKSAGFADEDGNYALTEFLGTLIASAAFVFTPGLLVAATRTGPLTTVLLPVLVVLVIAVRFAFRGGDSVETITWLREDWLLVLLALLLVGYSTFELVLARRMLLRIGVLALVTFFIAGAAPALLIAGCVRMRWLVGRRAQFLAFGGWAAVVLSMAWSALLGERLGEGRAANGVVGRIVANAAERGKAAVASDGFMDDLLFFMLPEKTRLVSLARERDPAYGRELSEWVRGMSRSLGSKSNNGGSDSLPDFACQHVEDLAFAAELGPAALFDEWAKIDRPGFETTVATARNYFPTRKAWDEACSELAALRPGEPHAKDLRHLLGVAGNALGCRMLEEGSVEDEGEVEERRGDSAVRLPPSPSPESDAWAIFKTIVDKVEPWNYGAYVNLLGMVRRGFDVPKDEVADLETRRQQIEKGLKSWKRILVAARMSGPLYADPEDLKRYEKAMREIAEKRELPQEARTFVETVAAAPKDAERGRAAQAAIHRALRKGLVKIGSVGGRLITIDLALGDVENAEKDAIDLLKIDRHDPTANAAIGSLAVARGDPVRAERYLRRAVATGRASAGAKNDLAWALYRLGRLDEAESFAREAVGALGESWAARETLAAILIEKGAHAEGEAELAKAEALAEKAGVAKGKSAGIEIDRARLLKAKGDLERFKIAIRALGSRRDLTPEQLEDVRRMNL